MEILYIWIGIDMYVGLYVFVKTHQTTLQKCEFRKLVGEASINQIFESQAKNMSENIGERK